MIAIDAKIRNIKDNLTDIRKTGFIPAVFYGAGKESTPITVPFVAFEKAFKSAGESSTISLHLPDTTLDVMIHDVQMDPVKHVPTHADFLVIDMNKPITVHVPLEFTGIAPAVKSGLGVLVKVMHELEISALPKDLPHTIQVDLAVLENLDQQIHVKDLKIPAKVTCLAQDGEVVALIAPAKEEVVEVAPVDLTAIEVEKKGKKEEEGVEPVVAEEKTPSA